jgi:uncharacterized repeat protein (TIGR03806 family)
MPRRILPALGLVALLVAPACAEPGGGDPETLDPAASGKADDPAIEAAFGLDARPSNATCVAPDRPASASSIATERVFESLVFSQPVGMHQPPGDDSEWFVVEKAGRIRAFANVPGATSARTVLDIRSLVDDGPNEAGLLGMAFHPDFHANGEVYLSFNMSQSGQLWSVLTRIRSTDGGQTLDPSTHAIVFSTRQPFGNHNGGQVVFGPDGLLYWGLGDGGDAGDPMGHGQNTSTPLGSMLRLDVDHPSGGKPYGIPSDNPFASGIGGLPEIYAFGLRNPWRFSFDQATGDLWLADVGQDAWEEIDIIERGGNYGWDLKEGFACFDAPSPCDALPVIDPVAVYDHSQGDRSITGGFVYRGAEIPGLQGSYVYGDIVTGRMWALFADDDGEGWAPRELLESGIHMASFAQDLEGEIYVLDFFEGTLHRIVPAGPAPVDAFPKRLSDTGCVDPSDPAAPAPGVIAYDVASPLWSDGADKQRFLAVPDGERIHMEQDGDFTFPTGSVLMKTFMKGGRRIETRLLVRHDDGGWAGYAYRWRADQSDADLALGSENVDLENGDTWRIPSRADCSACHTAAAGFALGPEFLQLNADLVYEATNRRSNQMDTLVHIGLFDNLADGDLDVDAMPRLFGLEDEDATLAERARSYLHSNCSSCHRPGGPGRSDADMRFLVPWASQGMCGVAPEAGAFGMDDAALVHAGDPDRSVLLHRMEALDAARMPALGSAIVDDDAVELFSAWIDAMNGCP